MVITNEPSPEITTTSSSGWASWAPSAAGRPKPIVPRPPQVIRAAAVEQVMLGGPHLVLADVGDHDRVAAGDAVDRLDHVLGLDDRRRPVHVVRVLALPGGDLRPPRRRGGPRRGARAGPGRLPPGREGRAASPAMPMWAARFLPISAGSPSIWMILARGAHSSTCRRPARRSARRRRSADRSPGRRRLAAAMPCMPGMPTKSGWVAREAAEAHQGGDRPGCRSPPTGGSARPRPRR